jgi:dTDP-4-dehydrorhamnose reductase
MKIKKEVTWQDVEKYIIKNCKVNDELLAISVNDLLKRYGTTRQNLHRKLDRILDNKKYKKVGEYILIKIK